MSEIAVMSELPAPGEGPAGLAWDGRYLWNADYRTGYLYCLEPDTGAVVDSLLCPGVVSGVAWDGQHLWQTVVEENWLRAVNPASHDFDRTLVVEGARRLGDATWDGSRLWVVDQGGALLAIAAEQQPPLRQIAAPAAGGGLAWRDGLLWLAAPLTMRYEPGSDSFVWNSAEERFVLLALDATNGVEQARYPLSFLPLGLAWAGEEMWLSDRTAARLYRARLV